MGKVVQEMPEFCPLFLQSTAMECHVLFQNYLSSLVKEQELKLRDYICVEISLLRSRMCQILHVP